MVEHDGNQDIKALEKRLKFDLFLGGDSPNEEDNKMLDSLKEKNIQKEQFPNVYKWRILMNKHFNK